MVTAVIFRPKIYPEEVWRMCVDFAPWVISEIVLPRVNLPHHHVVERYAEERFLPLRFSDNRYRKYIKPSAFYTQTLLSAIEISDCCIIVDGTSGLGRYVSNHLIVDPFLIPPVGSRNFLFASTGHNCDIRLKAPNSYAITKPIKR